MPVIPAIILAKSALDETVATLRRSELLNPMNCNRSLRGEIGSAIDLNLTEKATDCLRTSCASRHLTMLVIDPRTQLRYAIPGEYFDQRPFADLEFNRALFRAMELSKQVVADPLYKLVRPYRGWVHGFVESEFRAWLGNAEVGPLSGPQMRPFFNADLICAAKADRRQTPDPAKLLTRETAVRRPSRQKPFWSNARKPALDWLRENGFPVPGDGGQSKLEAHIAAWLTDHGHTASESTIREHVKTWIKEYKASVSAPEAD
jgi:hypothetical protein